MNKHDLKAYRENKPQINSLVPGINNINSVGGPIGLSRKSMPGEIAQLPLTTRYDANKSVHRYMPHYDSTLSSKFKSHIKLKFRCKRNSEYEETKP